MGGLGKFMGVLMTFLMSLQYCISLCAFTYIFVEDIELMGIVEQTKKDVNCISSNQYPQVSVAHLERNPQTCTPRNDLTKSESAQGILENKKDSSDLKKYSEDRSTWNTSAYCIIDELKRMIPTYGVKRSPHEQFPSKNLNHKNRVAEVARRGNGRVKDFVSTPYNLMASISFEFGE